MSFEKLMWHRVNIYALYYSVASQGAARYRDLDEEFHKLETEGVAEDELNEIQARAEACYQKREESAVVAITFAGMALEALLYDYAADTLGDEYVKEHLDKLDVKSKFLTYPKLVCDVAPDKSQAAYQKLTELVKLRNELVHFKSKRFHITNLDKASDFHDELNERLRRGVDDAMKCVDLVTAALDKLHGTSEFTRSMQSGVVRK